MVELPHDAFGARQHGSIMVQEIDPVMDIEPIGLLVGDITDYKELTFFLELDNLAKGVCHGNADGTLSLAQTKEELVNPFVLNRMVYLCALYLGRNPQG